MIEAKSTENLTKINFEELKFLFYSDWWDGPVSGLVEYKKQTCWFEVLKENDGSDPENYYRRYLIIELSVEQIDEFEFRQKLFEEKVGRHWTPDERGICNTRLVKPLETHHEFYDVFNKRKKLICQKILFSDITRFKLLFGFAYFDPYTKDDSRLHRPANVNSEAAQ